MGIFNIFSYIRLAFGEKCEERTPKLDKKTSFIGIFNFLLKKLFIFIGILNIFSYIQLFFWKTFKENTPKVAKTSSIKRVITVFKFLLTHFVTSLARPSNAYNRYSRNTYVHKAVKSREHQYYGHIFI